MAVTASTLLRHPEKAHRPDTPILRKPDWIRVKAPTSTEYAETKALMRRLGLNTVCEEAACPNIGECWKQKHATVMILGSRCTRACAASKVSICRPDQLDPHGPAQGAEAFAAAIAERALLVQAHAAEEGDPGADPAPEAAEGSSAYPG